ncbi:MAG: hypothetical protein R3F56_22610 [Planctomycetota bacterium]
MNRLTSLGLAVSSLCALPVAPAQTSVVVPTANASVDGNSLEQEPFGYDQITHMQYVDGTLLGGVPNGALLNQIAYRRDFDSTAALATMQRTGRSGPAPAIWEIWMQNYVGPVLSPPNNIQRTTWTNVMTPTFINFPDLPRGTGPTAPFDLAFVLDRPFVYGGGSLGIANLAYETAAANYAYLVDAVVSTATVGQVARISQNAVGCPAGENRCEGVAPNPGAGDLEFYLFGGKPSSAAVAYLGTNTTTWGGLPLPLPLTFLQLPTCSIYTDLVVPLPTLTNIAGLASMRVPVPAEPALTSATLYGQWVLRDDRVNPAVNLATSDGLSFTFGPTVGGYQVPMSIVSAANNLATGRTGFVRPGEGVVFRLGW